VVKIDCGESVKDTMRRSGRKGRGVRCDDRRVLLLVDESA